MEMDFFSQIESFGQKRSLILSSGEIVAYADLAKKADNVGEKLCKGSLVFNFCGNDFESVCGYLGFLRNNVPQALISPNIHEDLSKGLIEIYKPRYLWSGSDFNFAGYKAIYQQGRYTLSESIEDFRYEINPNLALLLTTSGSTGSPKFVRQTYKNIIANAVSISQYLEITTDDRPITTLPLSYTYGLSVLNSHLLSGSEIILTDKTFFDKDFWTALKTFQATTFSGVPFTYEMLKKLKFERMDLPSLTKLTQAGGKLSDQLCHEFADICHGKNLKFFVMYGQTEATARISYLDCSVDSDKIGSVGKSIPGGNLSLVDDKGIVIEEHGIQGELVYTGDNVALGYATNYKDLKLGDQNNGKLYTGDIAQRDQEGFYYIVGRKKRFLKVFGNRINLDELESLLLGAGMETACTGQDDKLKIYTTSSQAIPHIKALITTKLGISIKGDNVHVVDKFPRTESGKIEYSKLSLAESP